MNIDPLSPPQSVAGDYEFSISNIDGNISGSIRIDSDGSSFFSDPVRQGNDDSRKVPETPDEELSLGSITGVVWHDLNQDGLRQSTEPGISNVAIELLGDESFGLISRTTTSQANGLYEFDEVPEGIYSLRSIPPEGWKTTREVNGILPLVELSLEEILLLNSDFSVIAHPLGETTTLYALTNGFDFSNQSVISRDLGLYRIPTISSNPESVTISEAEINGFVEIAIKLLLSHPDLNEANVWSWRTHSESATSARQINPINGMTVESDYNDTAGAGIFFEGDTEKVVIVRINDDSLEESSEYFELQIDTFLSEIRTDEGSIILRIPFFIIDNDVVSGVTEKDDALSVAEPKEINFGSNDSASRRLTILNQEVSAIFSDENWIHVDTLPGNMGEREISISVEENDSLFTRTGYINVDEARVLVNQAGSSETQPPEEINVTEGVHRDRVRISWSSIEGADGYRIYRTEDSAFDENGFLGSVEEITFFDDFSAEENVTFYYWIRAVGQMGPSIPSSTNSGFASSTTLETGNIWRDAEPTGDGWRLSKWFGFLNDSFFPWIFHITHGFQYLASGSLESDLFLYDFEMMDWWWTTNDIYPSFYSFNRSNFQFYFEGTQHPRFFVDFGTGEIWEF